MTIIVYDGTRMAGGKDLADARISLKTAGRLWEDPLYRAQTSCDCDYGYSQLDEIEQRVEYSAVVVITHGNWKQGQNSYLSNLTD